MKKFFTSLRSLTVASIKMYARDRRSLFFSLLMPLAFLGVFGLLSKSGNASLKIDVTNYSHSSAALQVVSTLKNIPAFKVSEIDESVASTDLTKGNIDLQVIIPENFGQADSHDTILPSHIISHFNAAKPQNGQTANLVLEQIIANINDQISKTPVLLSVQSSGVTANNLNYFDFILPGILAMTIMQLGLFGVSIAFAALKASGALRRLQATPIHPRSFIFAQTITRLLVTLVSVAILVGFGKRFFGFHMNGSYINFAILVILGILVFLGMGLAIAGWAKDGNQAAPVANILQLPMLLLSGVFFPRDIMPMWLQKVTNYFPLTYLADGMRHIANEGQTLMQIKGEVVGLVLWGIIIYAIAGWVFRWE